MPTPFDFNTFARSLGITPREPSEETETPLEDEPAPPPTPTNATRVRPSDVAAMVGQTHLRVQLAAMLAAARVRDEQPGHCLFSGPPGLGKTTMAKIMAAETGTRLIENEATSVGTPYKMALELGKVQRGDIFFVDEIHALSRPTQELLGKAMEDGYYTMTTGTGKTTQSVTVRLPPFTVAGATTLAGNLTGPLRDRFAFKGVLAFYENDELAQVIANAAPRLDCKLDHDAAIALGSRSRGTPRIALNLLQKAIDYAVASTGEPIPEVTAESIEQALALYDIDALGLDPSDRTVLRSLCVDHMGGPVGVRNLAATSGVEERTIREVIEPYLIRARVMRRTTRGRLATKKAYRHFNLKPPITLEQMSPTPESAD